jgi:hypothetical protein
MRQLFLLIMLLLGCLGTASAQLQETFTDGDFTQNPAWMGDVASFQVNAAQQLQSKGPAVTGTTLQLLTPNTLAVGAQWEFYLQLAFATSSGNYAEVHLTSDNQDLKGAHQGYFVRIGGTEDEVSLYRKDGATAVRIINGPDKTVATTNNLLRVRVTRTEASVWNLEVDMGATGQNFISQGTAQDAKYTTSAFTGVRFTYSQANAQKFYFDDLSIRDISVPAISDAKVMGPKSLEVQFSEPLTAASAQNVQNYLLNGAQRPSAAEQVNASSVRLAFNADFSTGTNSLQVSGITDLQGNTARNLQTSFDYAPIAQLGDVRITEIYADLNPLQDLPAAEFFEIHNLSDKTFNLQNWKYSDGTTNTATFPSYLLKPGTYVIVTATADTALFKSYGEVVGLPSFPSLNDSGDEVELFNAQGQLIDKVMYSNAWYRDNQKKEGGWTLELVDVNTICTGAAAWKASEDPAGGTPGKVNSVQGKDVTAPQLVQAVTIAPDKVVLHFNEPLDSLAASAQGLYQISPDVFVSNVRVLPTNFSEVELSLSAPLRENVKYAVTVQGVKDCAGNVSASQQIVTLILPAEAQKGDVVINEILFNPSAGGVDFVELVNRTDKYLNLQNWQLANREKGEIANARTIASQSFILPPNAYLVLTSDSRILQEQYPNGKPETFLQLTSMPSFNDDAGAVVLLLPDKTVMDEVAYSADQHFKLIRDSEGISLERIQLNGPSVAANFHSAATAVKATPGYLNSQTQTANLQNKKLTLEPKVFTPDGDGVDDVLLLQFNGATPGSVANVTIFDASGREVRKLANNTLTGNENLVQWDGLTDKGTKAAIGYYIVLVEVFTLNGEKEIIKETAVVGGRF